MVQINDGQCGTCAHFGSEHAGDQQLVQIRVSHQAEPERVEPCGHPDHAPLNLRVSPVGACAGYQPGKVA